MIEYKKLSCFERGLLISLLKDGYSYNKKIELRDIENWKEADKFFFDNLENIGDKYCFVTTLNDEPIGFVCWDPRNIPEYVEIGHNCIKTIYKGNGYGTLQMKEAIKRILEYKNLKKIIVRTDEESIFARKMYESCGFKFDYKTETKTPDEYISGGNYAYIIKLR